jgi:hypothetical protein
VFIVGGLLVGVFGLLMWADETEHGGWEAMDGLAEGYLPDGFVEVREVPWARGGDELATSYEVRLVDADTYEVAFIDRQGQVLLTGSLGEVGAWLDDQGEQVFIGTQSETSAWIEDARDTEKSFLVPAVVMGFGLLLLIIGLIPNRHSKERQPDLTVPAAPAV